MSKEEVKKSFAVPPLDGRILKGLVEKIGSAKINVDKQILALAQARADYDEYMARLAPDTDLTAYQINWGTLQIEPIPPKADPPEPVKAPDAAEPPAPFVPEPPKE